MNDTDKDTPAPLPDNPAATAESHSRALTAETEPGLVREKIPVVTELVVAETSTSAASAVPTVHTSAPAPAPAVQAPRQLAPVVLMVAAVLFLYGLGGSLILRMSGIMDVSEKAPNIYFYLYSYMEPAMMFGMMGLCVLFAIFIDNRTRVPELWPQNAESPMWRRFVYLLFPALVLAITLGGTFWVMHDYALGPDEYLSQYQTEAIARGTVAVPVPREVAWLGQVIKPSFVTQVTVEGQTYWVPAYLSGYAFLRGAFLLMGAPWLLGPLLTAGSIVLIALIARQIWPERTFADTELIAAALLAVSSQAVLTGMTAYAMPAHLFFNLLWLWLFLRNTTLSFVLAGIVGLVTILLQQPMLHVLFVVPLLLRLVWNRRWAPAACFAAFYGAVLWFTTFHLAEMLLPHGVAEAFNQGFGAASAASASPDASVVHGSGSVFSAEESGPVIFYLRSLSFPLFFSWEALPLLVLSLAALWNWRRLPPVVRDLTIGFALVYVLYMATRTSQGHGWGYRYCHAVIGNIVLLAVAGWPWFAASAGRARAGFFLSFGLAVALALQIPYRAWCAEQIVRPFATSSLFLNLQQERFLLLDVRYKWYGDDLIHNGPFFDNFTPVVVRSQALTAMNKENLGVLLDQLRRLGPIKLVKPDDLTQYGLPTLSETAMRNKGFLNKDGSSPTAPPPASQVQNQNLPAQNASHGENQPPRQPTLPGDIPPPTFDMPPSAPAPPNR